jgi:hypothetical protein
MIVVRKEKKKSANIWQQSKHFFIRQEKDLKKKRAFISAYLKSVDWTEYDE